MAPPRALNFVPTQFSTWRWLLFSSSSPQVNVKITLFPTFGSCLIVYFDFGEVLFAVGGGASYERKREEGKEKEEVV